MITGSVRSTVEPLEGNKVRLSVEVDEGELDGPLEAAFRRMARSVKVPGFRPGKVPRRLLEARLGAGVARQEALRDAIPEFYQRALDENAVEPIAPPDIDITAGHDAGPLSFDAVVEVMPEVSVAGYDGLRVVLPSFEVTEEEVDRQVNRLREQFAELRPVQRPAATGDHVSMDRRVYRHDENLLVAEDELYEVGGGAVGPGGAAGGPLPQLDEQLIGARAGDILKFNVDLPQTGEVTFQVLVKEVREKLLPDLTDDWASDASEFDTVEELRANIREQIEAVKRLEAALTVRDKVIEALVELVDEEMPESLVGGELERRLQMLLHRLQHQGLELNQYLQARGMTQEQLVVHLRAEADNAVKADLALRAVAERENLDASDAAIEEEIAQLADREGRTVPELRRELENEGRLPAVRSGIRKSKALEWLISHTELVDEEGRVIDRAQLTPPELQAPGHTADPGGAEEAT